MFPMRMNGPEAFARHECSDQMRMQPGLPRIQSLSLLPIHLEGRSKACPHDSLPRSARLAPTSDSNITIEVWMPLAGWNGRLLGLGNGGFAARLLPMNWAQPWPRATPPRPPMPAINGRPHRSSTYMIGNDALLRTPWLTPARDDDVAGSSLSSIIMSEANPTTASWDWNKLEQNRG